eukprot:SAG31_NODE_188_length_20842_cov_31.993444_8_plen_158_part_00
MRLQAGTEKHATAAIANILKESRLMGFFTGTSIGLMLIPADTAIQFMVFERLRWLVRQSVGAFAESAAAALVLGGIAKCVAVAVMYPPRRAKDVLMSQSKATETSADKNNKPTVFYAGLMDCMVGTFRLRGLGGLYSVSRDIMALDRHSNRQIDTHI